MKFFIQRDQNLDLPGRIVWNIFHVLKFISIITERKFGPTYV